MRTVICHYHIFKNAGTSFGHVLDASFGPRHLSFDGPFPFFTIDQEQLDRIILRKADAVAFSSHQIQLPVPVSGTYRVEAVLFLREPVLRLGSLWRFKRAAADGTLTAEAAGRMDFADWLDWSLDHPQEVTQVSNSQTRAVAAPFRGRAVPVRRTHGVEYDLAQARANLAGVVHLGRADHFDADLVRIAAGLSAAGLSLKVSGPVRLNATAAGASADGDTVAAQAARLLGSLPPRLADRVRAANAQDARLYAEAAARLEPFGKAA